MGVRTLHDRDEGAACFYDSTTGVAFGPVFDNLDLMPEVLGETPIGDAADIAEAFLVHLRDDLGVPDPRHKAPETLVREYERWRAAVNVPEVPV